MARYLRIGETIRLKDAKTISAAFEHACRLDLRPNYWITIHWHWTAHAYSECQSRALWCFLERLRKWFFRREMPVVWIYVRERANSAQSEHVHLLLHCPTELEDELNGGVRRWAEAQDPRAVVVKPCLDKTIRGMPYNSRSLALGYMLKGGDDKVRAQFPRSASRNWSREQGTIRGKRVGVSAVIGPKAIASYFGQRCPSDGSCFETTIETVAA